MSESICQLLPATEAPPGVTPPFVSDRKSQLLAVLAAIETMGLSELRVLWTRHFGSPPELRSVDLLRLSLSWRLQARVHGGLDAAMRKRLRRKTIADPGSAIYLELGTILNREWQGQPHIVEVVGDGFRWKGTTYSSLSAAAKAITGTNWNGPRFFGLRKGKR
jgi:hypothetical protein